LPVAAHNQTRLRILAGILRLERFSVADLCAHAGLLPSMVYRELAELQREGVLESKSSLLEGETAPAHRPRKWYQLTSDAEVREGLEQELASFLPDADVTPEDRHLKRAQELLTTLTTDLLVSPRVFSEAELNRWEAKISADLDEARTALRRATWESEIDFSEEGQSDHPIMLATHAYETLQAQFKNTVVNERGRRRGRAARVKWGELLSATLREAIPLAVEAGTGAMLLDSAVSAAWISEKLSQQIKELVAATTGPSSKLAEFFLPFAASLQLDLREVQSSSEWLAALAKHGIAYGSTAAEPLACIRELAAGSQDYRLFFNEANLAKLAHEPGEAYDSWTRYLSNLKAAIPEENVEKSIVARVSAEHWSEAGFVEAVRIITMQCEASVTALSETPFEKMEGQIEGYSIGPQLYNPLPGKFGPEVMLIPIAEPLAQNQRLYIATTDAERPAVVGLPSVARAGWFQRRMREKDAWNLAAKVGPSERIIKIDFFRTATGAARDHAEVVLRSSLAADIVG
jgi:hypothetical protein